MSHIRNFRWTALKDFHEKSTLTNIITLMRNVWDLKLEETKDPAPHIEEMSILLKKCLILENQTSAKNEKLLRC